MFYRYFYFNLRKFSLNFCFPFFAHFIKSITRRSVPCFVVHTYLCICTLIFRFKDSCENMMICMKYDARNWPRQMEFLHSFFDKMKFFQIIIWDQSHMTFPEKSFWNFKIDNIFPIRKSQIIHMIKSWHQHGYKDFHIWVFPFQYFN